MNFNLNSYIEEADRIGIAGHVRPDGDCVGSVLGVYNYIRDTWPKKDVHAFLQEIPACFTFLSHAENLEEPGEEKQPFDLFIVLDCGSLDRLGPSGIYFEEAEHTVCIDHHLSNDSFAEHNYIFPHASSTCELIYDLLPKDALTKEIAACLYTGMVTDTGIFQYSSTSHSTMDAAGTLMDLGIDYPDIVDRVFNEKTYAENRLLGVALMKSELSATGSVISSIVTAEEMKSCGAGVNDTDGIAARLRTTKGVQASIFLHENADGSWKGSLRGRGHILDLSQVAAQYHGGGHAMASGFQLTAEDDPRKAISQITDLIEKQLQDGGFYK